MKAAACFCAIALLAPAASGRAQDGPAAPPELAAEGGCTAHLAAAEKSYELGDFETIPGELAPCLPGSAPRSERIRAHALLARAYLALDDVPRAREAIAALLRLDADFEPGAPPQLVRLFAEVRRAEAAGQVASVSKSRESLREAPATVIVVTAGEIERRGYLDLEQILHDLPGFDLTRGNGELYANVYQRGFRASFNDRMLLLLDGIEQSDLSSGAVHLSRQYPLGNVERIEVVYGPASTMYGANAYTGVINVVTKEPEDQIPAGSRYGVSAQVVGGSFDTRSAELNLVGRNRPGTVSWSLTGRQFRSDEMDLSGFDDWDYDYTTIDYGSILRLEGALADTLCGLDPDPAIFRCQEGLVELTDAGVELARRLDRELVAGQRFAFADSTDDWSIHGKLRISNLTLGLQLWRQSEGTAPWFTERLPGGQNGEVLQPAQTAFSLRYARSFASNLALRYSARYKQTEVHTPELPLFAPLASGGVRLFALRSCLEGATVGCFDRAERTALDYLSTQLTTELSLVYQRSDRLDVVSGLEFRRSSIENDLGGFFRDGELVSIDAPVAVEHTGFAVYTQASYRFPRGWKLVAGGRLDYDENDTVLYSDVGYGTLFSPRLALVHVRPKTVWKAIYTEAFKDPTDAEKLRSFEDASTGVRGVANPSLSPEKVRNLELAVGWQPRAGTSLDVAAFQAEYDDLVATIETEETGFPARQRANLGAIRVRGLQATGTLDSRRLSLFGNYTYTASFDTRPLDALGEPLTDAGGGRVDELRVADVARHRVNLGAHAPLGHAPLGGGLDLDLRLNWVGARRTGAGTTVPTNPFRQIDPYVVTHATLTWKLPAASLLAGAALQLIANNLLDEGYDDPGVQEAGTVFAARIPQPGRTVFLRLAYGWRGAARPAP